MKRAILESLVALRREKKAAVLLVPLDGSDARIWSPAEPSLAATLDADAALREAAILALRTDATATIDAASGKVLVTPHNPPLRLAVVGAVHIAEPLVAIAQKLGYEVTLIDPRVAFARKERWPGVDVRAEWPEDALPSLALDARTALVALTHDPKIDEPALEIALRSPAFYIGALGSKKTHAARLARLGDKGLDAATLARVHGPVGLAIGARSPGEIAVSIVAQMTDVLRRGGDPQRQGLAPTSPEGAAR